jgi:predicted ATP-grasp superfamily ATP-dependent carboligase
MSSSPESVPGSFGIAYVKKKEDLVVSYQRVHERYPFPMIQEWIPDGGGVYGLSALLDEASNIKAAFVHKKLRMYPVQGGPSTLREGVEHPQIMELGLSLLKSLNWVGVGMVEFKVDPRDGIPKLMEVNPRFWGSLQLAIVSGVDFPYLILKMARGESFEPILSYTVGKRCRWLLLGDILHFLNNPNRFHLRPSFFQFFDPNTSYDIISRDDLFPVMGSAATFFTFLYDPEMKRFLETINTFLGLEFAIILSDEQKTAALAWVESAIVWSGCRPTKSFRDHRLAVGLGIVDLLSLPACR